MMIKSFFYLFVFHSGTNNFTFIDGFLNPQSRIASPISSKARSEFEDETITDSHVTEQKNQVDSKISLKHMNRRQAIFSPLVSILCGISLQQRPANAVITDETDNFGDNWWAAPSTSTTPRPSSQQQAQQSTVTPSDEITIQIPKSDLQSKEGLGLELGEVEFRTNRRVYIKSVLPGSVADRLGIKKDWVVVSINGDVSKNLH
jgi:hypothetical protein